MKQQKHIIKIEDISSSMVKVIPIVKRTRDGHLRWFSHVISHITAPVKNRGMIQFAGLERTRERPNG